MTDPDPMRLLALLVHNGLLSAATAKAALASGDVRSYVLREAGVSAEQWQEWMATEAGTRPQLRRYELGDLLGEGGTARVFRATERETGEVSAIKVLKPELCRDATAVEKFIHESKLLIALESPRITKGIRVARDGQNIFCSMELIDGPCLQDEIDEDHPLAEQTALRVVVEVAEGLSHLHQRGFVHRDIKPGNIMLRPDGSAVLIDLGFAVDNRDSSAPEEETTAGTVHYISPEQARGQSGLDARADIYSLGATLYHLVTGSLPFGEGDSQEVLARQVLESLSGERIRRLGLSPQTHYFVEKMMAKEKEIRFQSPAELIEEIGGHLEQRELEEKLRSEAEEKRKKSGRRRRRWM